MNGVAHDPANHHKPSAGVEEEEDEGGDAEVHSKYARHGKSTS